MSSSAKVTPHIAKMRLLNYTYEVEYLLRHKNKVSDYFSRSPLQLHKQISNELDEYSVAVVDCECEAISKEERLPGYEEDEVLSVMMKHVLQGWPSKNKQGEDCRKFWERKDELSISCLGFLLKGDRVVPPQVLRQRILEIMHKGHLSIVKSKKKLKLHTGGLDLIQTWRNV